MSSGLLRLIRAEDPTTDFRCGERALDQFFSRHALLNSDAEESLGKTWVLPRALTDPPDWPPILGFITLSMSSLDSASVAAVLKRALPKYPAPVALLGRMAVDQRAQGNGVSEILMQEAFRQVARAGESLGCLGLAVEAKTERLVHFYEARGFSSLDPNSRLLFCPMGTIRESR